MIFRQITHDDLGCASYLVGDEHAGVAAVVDPRLEIDEYLELARYIGVSIEHILETHNHADHVSGHGRLAAATGARIYIHRLAQPAYEHQPIDDGFELEVGQLLVRAFHTPGHRPEHTAFALIDRNRGEDPWAVLTGDTLFVNDVARPDLAIEGREGARGIYHSLQDKLLSLPDDCEVWPAHLGGSMCGGPGMDMKISSTIGFERKHNPTLAIGDEKEFVEQAVAKLGPQPPNFEAIVELNKGPLLTEGAEVLPLAPRQVELKRSGGAMVVDARTDQQFDDAHIPGAVCIPMLTAGFGSKLAWLANRDQGIVLVGRDDEDGRRAARLAVAVGISKLAGFLGGGMTSWRQEKRDVERIERLPLDDLAQRSAETDLQILDVRERSEWDAGHIPGSIFEPWHDIDDIPEGLDPAKPIAVVCGSGQRAAVGASLVKRYGADDVVHVIDGGVPKWKRLGRPIEQG
ncbi:MAG TPA: rhodanese-like domain-containing protein [Thermoleophilaceae bacterium]|nr:rhodanese-like domain-containing protein [Thermoleophilaceae bacterium]